MLKVRNLIFREGTYVFTEVMSYSCSASVFGTLCGTYGRIDIPKHTESPCMLSLELSRHRTEPEWTITW